MRTIAGLIVGLGLGLLLSYFTASTARVQGLKAQPPAATAPEGPETPGAALAVSLSAAAAAAATAGLEEGAVVVVVDDQGPDTVSLEAVAFTGAAGARPGLRIEVVGSVAEAVPLLATAERVFCPYHSQLRELLVQAGDRRVPPLYTVGWSAWLLSLCAAADSPLTGVAVADPAAAVRALTPCQDEQGPPEAGTAPVAVAVLTPAQVVAAFGTPAGTTAAADPGSRRP